jgi:hypothetical protein
MAGPRPLDNGAKVGYGLIAFIVGVFAAMVAAAAGLVALLSWAYRRA